MTTQDIETLIDGINVALSSYQDVKDENYDKRFSGERFKFLGQCLETMKERLYERRKSTLTPQP